MRYPLLASLLLAAGCASGRPAVDPVKFHSDALAATEPKAVGAPETGSPAQAAAVARFREFFGDLREDRVRAKIREVYAPEVWFNDTLRSIRGVDELERYLVATARNVEACSVDVDEVVPSPGGVYVRWRMHIKFKKFRKGQTQDSIGVTLLRFDKEGRVAYHQDYWDSGSNFFEKVPVLGAGIRAVKRRL